MEEAERKSGGGLSHRQTLKALKARKEGERERAQSRKVVVEGEEGTNPFARSSRKQQAAAAASNANAPVVRQIAKRKTAKELKQEAEEALKAEETEEEKEKRRAAHKARKAKMADMLAALQ